MRPRIAPTSSGRSAKPAISWPRPRLPRLESGDLIAIGTAGAYGAVQAGTYNTRLLVPEVLVDGDRFHVVRPRRRYDDLIGLDSMPDWLK